LLVGGGMGQDLGLAKTVNTIIGDGFARGVSGGERKRVAIGVGKCYIHVTKYGYVCP